MLLLAVFGAAMSGMERKMLEMRLYGEVMRRYQLLENPPLFEDFWSLVWTVVFSDGQCLSEINCLSDAIIHCRSGCGSDTFAGPRLLEEMRANPDLASYMLGPNSTVNAAIVSKIQSLPWGSTTGTDKITQSGKCFSCQTLGGYCGAMDASFTYSCVDGTENRVCSYQGLATLTGHDVWDFEVHPEWPWWKNLIREVIPEWLVSWRGSMKVFNAYFNVTEPLSGQFEQRNTENILA